MTIKSKAFSKEAIILGVFLAATFILQLMPKNPNPLIPDWPYSTLFDGGIGITILYYVTYKIPGQIRDLGERIERNLLGSLLESYSDFKEELRKRLTETE